MSNRNIFLSPLMARKLTFLLAVCLRWSLAPLGRNRTGEGRHHRLLLRLASMREEREGEMKIKEIIPGNESSGREVCLCTGMLQEVGHRLPHRPAGKPFE